MEHSGVLGLHKPYSANKPLLFKNASKSRESINAITNVRDFSTPKTADKESPADSKTQYAIIHTTANPILLLSYNFFTCSHPIYYFTVQPSKI